MPNDAGVQKEIDQYLSRLDDLYASVKDWLLVCEPQARLRETTVELAEKLTGPYKAKSLEIGRPGKTAVRLVPRGMFMVGAHGRVDARSRLGREILVWVETGGPHIHMHVKEGDRTLEQVTRPLYTKVEEGWAWADEQRLSLLHLTERVFRDNVMASLSE